MALSGIDLVERGYVPDFITRMGIRHYTGKRLQGATAGSEQELRAKREEFINLLRNSPIAIDTEAANAQHYEVPSRFYQLCLGDNLKYSCAYYTKGDESLEQAEKAMFALYAERAQLRDGMKLMDLGCGWGSLTLWLAQTYPNMQITSVSNSRTQKTHIDTQAAQRGFKNVSVITANVNDFDIDEQFDRVISIEMFEHMRNYHLLLEKISRWLKDDGKLFVHIFCHRSEGYAYEIDGDGDWMARNFFTGGVMPSKDLLMEFDEHMHCANDWWVNGEHYSKTSRDWLANLDANKTEAMAVFREHFTEQEAKIQLNRWRMFFLTCEEFFAWNKGEEWGVGHYLFEKNQ